MRDQKRRLSVLVAASSLSLCLALSPVASPQEAQDVSKPLQYEVSVVLKLIQVYVTDKAGNPVRDLAQDEFVVLDDGRAMKITAFEKHDLPTPGAETPTTEPSAAAAPAAPVALGRKFILLFDFAYNNQKGAGASLKAALHFLDADVRPSDEVAVISYSTLRGLRIHEFLTLNHAKVRQAVTALSARDVAGRAEDVEGRFAAFTEASGYASPTSAEVNQQSAARTESKLQAQNYIARLTALAQGLRLVPGQKNVLFFSTGVPYSLVNSNASPGGAGDTVLQPLYQTLMKEFSASNCSFYAFDTRQSAQVTSLFGFDEGQLDGDSGGYIRSSAGVRSSATNPFRDDKLTGMDTLKKLSSTTGGQYFSNIGFYEKNLAQVQTATGTYYVLGYSLNSVADGQFHEVKVEVKRKDCQIRAQRGYFDLKPFREFTPLEKDLQLFDLALNDRTTFSLPKTFATAALCYDTGEGTVLRTISRIPRDVRDGFEDKTVEFMALVFDGQENVVSLQRKAADLTRFSGGDIVFSSTLTAKPGAYKCRLVVRDLDTGRSAVGSTPAFVPGPAAGFVLFSPLLVVAGGPSAYLDGTVKGAAETPAWRDIYPYDAARYRPVVGDEAVDALKIAVILPYRLPDADRAQVSFSAHLVDSASGRSCPAVSEPLARLRRGTVEVLVLELRLSDVPPGRYTLFVNGSDKTSGGLATAHVPLTVAHREAPRVP